ncbi:MAG TPA: hypothetical protein VJB65_00625 [Patescibacteria group bacterium]|nr:hypothetical protein [Patescibacteria group bacterium]
MTNVVSPQSQNDEQKKVIKASIEEMVTAFNVFHDHMITLTQQQKDIITQIRARVDQQKIQQILETLKQV